MAENKITDDNNSEEKDDSRIVAMSHTFSGPLPAPQDFFAYKNALASAPERIMKMAEEEQRHRMKIENRNQIWGIVLGVSGLIVGAIIVLLFLYVGYLLGKNGHDALGGAAFGVTAALAIIFVLRKMPKKDK